MFEHEKQLAQSNEHHKRTVDNLVDELSVLFDDAENADIEKIDLCLDELDDLDPQDITFDAEDSLKHFHSRYDSSVPFKPSVPEQRKRVIRHPVRYFSAAAIAVALAGSLLAQAAGYDVWGRFFSWTREQFYFSPPAISDQLEPPSVAPGKDLEYDSIQDALDACGVDVPVAPRLFPVGYQYESISVTVMSAYSKVNATLSNGDSQILASFRIYSDPNQMSAVTTEKDGTPVVEVQEGGITHYIMNNNSKTVAVWVNEAVYGMISGDISADEMKEVITSIYN